MTITPLHLRPDSSPLDPVFAQQNKATPDLFQWMEAFVQNMGRGPTAQEIYGAANFGQPGGLGRLLEALVEVGRRRSNPLRPRSPQ